ncbi:MAG: autotransporter-associated beta strand repeat-containing protein [Kiritimatiellia bacterium]|jgi:autotransporter-associated beta strand protein|nr:autotransporter-associated beta strand repeat-containing protein [Kiritimatiellia bacterium]
MVKTSFFTRGIRIAVPGFGRKIAALALAAGSLSAADGVWTASGDGAWGDLVNWEGGAYAAGAGFTAYFTNGVPARVDQNVAGLTLGGLYVSGADTLFTNSTVTLNNNGNPALVTVEGNAVTATVALTLSPAAGTAISKAGTGTLRLEKYLTVPSGLTVENGLLDLRFKDNSDGLNVGSGTITVGNGAVLRCGGNNQINNYAVLDIQAGGTVDQANKTDNIGALTGSGVLTNHSSTIQFWLNGATRLFSGMCYGGGTFSFKEAGTFVAGNSNTLQNVTFDARFPGLNLTFAPGIGTFRIGTLLVTNDFTLADTENGPVTLELGWKNDSFSLANVFTGAGGLTKAGTGTMTVTNTQTYAGPTVVDGGKLAVTGGTLGTLLANTAQIRLESGSALELNTTESETNDTPLYGSGAITKTQESTLALGALRTTNAAVTVSAGTLEIAGGTFSGGGFTQNAGARVVFNGGSSTGATLTVSPGYPVEIRGGTHLFDSALGGTGRYLQTGGATFFKNTLGNINTNDIFVTVSGGTMNIGYIQHCQGLGLLACGTAVVNIANANTRIASDGKTHSLVVTNDAQVTTDGLVVMSNGAAGTTSTGTVTLAGGTLIMQGGFGTVGSQEAHPTFVNFDGGLLRFLGSRTSVAGAYHRYNVREGGARVEAATVGSTTTFNQGFTNATGGTVDGGLIKSGPGLLRFLADNGYTGASVLNAGTLTAQGTGGTPFGYGPVTINGGTLEIAPSGSGANLSMSVAHGDAANTVTVGPGVSMLRPARGSQSSLSVTLGAAGAAENSVLKRDTYGVLAIWPGAGTATLGGTEKVLVNGGVATVNGMVPAVFGIHNDDRRSCDFLTYDATDGFSVAAYTSGLGGGDTSIANVTANASTDSVHVHALRVHNGAVLTVNSGQTLTVGDGVNPAGVILNNSSGVTAGLNGGTLDFGTSEGVIIYNLRRSNQFGPTLGSVIAGSNGLTLAGGGPDEDLQLTASANTYTGPTRIMAGRVSLANSRGFSDGDVYIYGNEAWGGQFRVTFTGNVTNALHLAGVGAGASQPLGAVVFERDSEISGPVELMRDARVSVSILAAAIGTFSGPITGPGGLEVGCPGTAFAGIIRLTGSNTYTGGTRVSRGTLEIAAPQALAPGPVVVNDGVLMFTLNGDATITNAIRGTGRVVQNGAGTLTLTDAEPFGGTFEVQAGALVVEGADSAMRTASVNGLLDLNGEGLASGALEGGGVVSNSAAGDATLTVGADGAGSRFWGAIRDGEGAVSLVKTGNGTLTLSGLNTYSGATTIEAGTLRLQGTQTELPTNGLAYRLDAARADLLTLDGSNVTMWADASGAGVHFTQDVSVLQPVLVTNASSGLPAVRFGGRTNCLIASKSALSRSVFVVNEVRGYRDNGGLWGGYGQDISIRQSNLTSWIHPGNGNDFSCGGRMFVNDTEDRVFAAGAPHVLAALAETPRTWVAAIGDCRPYSGTLFRSYQGDVNEVAVYSTALSLSDAYSVTECLRYKWLGLECAFPTNVLPDATALLVSEGGTLDLNGLDQEVGSLEGAGGIANGSGRGATFTVGNDNRSTLFSGVISGSNTLVKVGGGTLALSGANTYLGDTRVSGGILKLDGGSLASGGTVTVGAGATFDVNGQPQTLAGIGGSGTISGCDSLTVTETVAPGGVGEVGTLALDGSPVFDGCTLLVDTRENGLTDTLSVAGDLDLSTLTLVIGDVSRMAGYSYEIVACSGNLTGTFAATPNLPGTWVVQYDTTPGAGKVTLVHDLGTILLFR